MCQIARPERTARRQPAVRPLDVLLTTPPAEMTDEEYRAAVAGSRAVLWKLAVRRINAGELCGVEADDAAQEACVALLTQRRMRRAEVPFGVRLCAVIRGAVWKQFALGRERRRRTPTVSACTGRDGRAPEAVDSQPRPDALASARLDSPLPPPVAAAVSCLLPRHREAVGEFLAGDGTFRADGANRSRLLFHFAVTRIRERLGGVPHAVRETGTPRYRVKVERIGRDGRQTRRAWCSVGGKTVYLGVAHTPESMAYFAAVKAAVAERRPVPKPTDDPSFRPAPRRCGPSYRRLADGSGRVQLWIKGQSVGRSLGRHGTPDSVARYHALMREHGFTPPPGSPPFPATATAEGGGR